MLLAEALDRACKDSHSVTAMAVAAAALLGEDAEIERFKERSQCSSLAHSMHPCSKTCGCPCQVQELVVQKQSAAVKSASLLQEVMSSQQGAAARSASPPSPCNRAGTVPARLNRYEIFQSLII